MTNVILAKRHYLSKEDVQKYPTFFYERQLIAKGFRGIVGVDEVGVGALAGPVVAAAVIFPFSSRLADVRDSKLITESMRERLYEQVIDRSRAWAIGSASVEEIDALGIRKANLLAMQRAVEQISEADVLLVDAWHIPAVYLPQVSIMKGDRLVKSIAAASIIAKVTRDRLMRVYAKDFPVYRFDVHKGYATKTHRLAIAEHGVCPIHRKSFRMIFAVH